MATLHLNLTRRWFDMVQSGEKREEYRDLTPFWKKRIIDAKFDTVTFSNGYSTTRPQIVFAVRYISIGRGREEWGADLSTDQIILHLGRMIN